jgi:hypothetical protein
VVYPFVLLRQGFTVVRIFQLRSCAAITVAVGSLAFATSAGAATLSVDDDGQDCPAAAFTSIQAAVDAAAPGDTVAVCAGDYAEGNGQVGTNALTITKSLSIKGAGADLVSISPKASGPTGGQIMESGTPDLRNGIGDVLVAAGAPSQPITVNLSGITVDGYAPGGKPVAVEAGVVYLDAKGSIERSRVTNSVTSEGNTAYTQPGGYRGTQPGIGIVQTSAARVPQSDGTRTLKITATRVDKYNKIGVLIDGAQGDTPPLVASGAINRGEFQADQIVGRTQCINYLATGDCSSVGGVQNSALADGPLFGQDGIRVTSGARAQITGSLISQNLVNGTGSPVRGGTTNNGALTQGAGIRLIGATMTTAPVSAGLRRTFNTSVTSSNITDNAYGALNYKLDGTSPNTGLVANIGSTGDTGTSNVFFAQNNWWGQRITVAPNNGPAISPTTNPPWPENPVGGAATTDAINGGATSDSVAFFPYRSGVQSATGDPSVPFDMYNLATLPAATAGGEFPVQDAPFPVNDAAPTAALSASVSSVDAGGSVTLTATASDDFGVKSVKFYDGGVLVGTATKPPYTQAVTVPAAAVCGSTRQYTVVAKDSIDQSAASAVTPVTVTCPTPPTPPVPPVAAPTVKFVSAPTTIKAATTVNLDVTAGAGVKSVQLRLGNRVVCTVTAAPYSCKITPTGADVGKQSLVATVTDKAGTTAVATVSVTVPKFKPTVSLKIKSKKVAGGKKKRTITGTVKRPAGVTAAQGCKGKVTVVIKQSGRSLLNQQVTVSKKCTFSRSVTASSKKLSFSVSAKFGGNTVLTTASTTRRFS